MPLFRASVICYIISLCVPAFYFRRDNLTQACFGLAALISGIFGLLGGYFCWLANPVIIAVWVAARNRKPGVVILGALLACGLCLSFLGLHSILVDEAGNHARIVGLGLGFWLWLLTPLLMIFHGLFSPEKKGVPKAAVKSRIPSMNPPAFSVVRTVRTEVEADMLITFLRSEGLHPTDINTSAHFALAGAEVEFPIQVPTDELRAARKLLKEHANSAPRA
jgi:hypothetical protein